MNSVGDRTTGHERRVDERPGGDPAVGLDTSRCSVVRSPTEFKPCCTSLLGVLFSIRSRYLSTIGLEVCLVLAVDAGHVHEGDPTPDTLELTHTVLVHVTGLSPCITLRSRRLLENVWPMGVSPNTTLPEGFGLDCVAFTRGY